MKGMICAAALLGLTASAASAVTVANGGFANTGPAGGWVTLPAGNTTGIPGWIVDTGNVEGINQYWQSADGDGYSVDMNGSAPGAISQSIGGLVAGQKYVLKFALSGNPDGGPANKTLQAGLINSGDALFSYDIQTNGTTKADMKWLWQSFAFIAAGSTDTLFFTSLTTGACCYGPAIDAVSIDVAPVPLPATLPLVAAGLGGLAMLRRRRKG